MPLKDIVVNFGGPGVNVKGLPQVVLDAGFHPMVGSDEKVAPNPTFSFVVSHLGHTTGEGHFYPGGLTLRGQLRLLGEEGSAEITIIPSQQLKVNVTLPPLNVSGFTMQRSANQRELGPWALAYVRFGSPTGTPDVTVTMSGTINIFGSSADASFDISNSGVSCIVPVKLFGLYFANLTMTAGYANLAALKFNVRGVMHAELARAVEAAAQNAVTMAINKTPAAIRIPQAAVEKANATLLEKQNASNAAKANFYRMRDAEYAANADVAKAHVRRLVSKRISKQMCF